MKNTISFLILLFTVQFYGQENEKPYRYYDKYLNITYDAKTVAFFSLLEFEEDIVKNNIIIYHPDGKIKKYERFSNYQKRIFDGVSEEFYENGQVKQQKNYSDNKEDGNQFYFWEDGTLKRQEIYSKGKFIDGRCFDKSGKKIEYYPFFIRASFPGGMEIFYNYVSKNINSRLIKTEEEMLVTFTIDTTGAVTDIKIRKGIGNKNLNSSIINTLSKCPKWSPASEDGVLVSLMFSLPINLKTDGISFPGSESDYNNTNPYFESQLIKF